MTAANVAPLAETYGCAVTPLDLSARTRLDALVNAAVPTHPRWHVSPVQGSRVPLAFAWFGPDVLAGAAPSVLTRGPGSRLGLHFPDGTTREGAHDALDAAMAQARLKDPTARWRQDPATPKQIAWLTAHRIRVRDGLTKGEAADLMSRIMGRSS